MKPTEELRLLEELCEIDFFDYPMIFLEFEENGLGFFFDPVYQKKSEKILTTYLKNGIIYFKKDEVKKVYKNVLIG